MLAESGTVEDTAKAAGMTPTEVTRILNSSKRKLWDYRSSIRPKPHRDEKVCGFPSQKSSRITLY